MACSISSSLTHLPWILGLQVFQTKRKPLDMSEQRAIEDKGGGSFGAPPPLPPLRRKGAKPAVGAAAVAAAASSSPSAGFAKPKSNVPKWKAQSGQLRAAMAASRAAKTGDLPYAVPSPPDDVSSCSAAMTLAASTLTHSQHTAKICLSRPPPPS